MSDLKLTGTIKVVNDTQLFDSGFSKREFVISTFDTYPQDVKFEVVKDKCALLDKYKVGSKVDVSFNIRGNEFKGKYYVSLQAWKIEASSNLETAKATAQAVGYEEEVEDDLPF